MKIVELDLEPNVHCQHECEKGCEIYNDRPKECDHFNCLWKFVPELMEEDKHHPIKCGFFLYFQGDTIFGDLVVAQEAWEGAFDYGYVKAEIIHLARHKFNRVIYMLGLSDKNRTLVGPKDKMVEALKCIEATGVNLETLTGEPK